MRGREFLQIVECLQPLSSEASLRSQLGRLYYAAYLEARAWCETNLGYHRVQLGREHADVQRMLASIDFDLADSLAFLRGYRNTADYDLHVSVDTLLGQKVDALDRVGSIITRLDALEPPTFDPEPAPESDDIP